MRGAKGVLSPSEEQELSAWLISMVERGYGLSQTALKMKVSEITMSRVTPSYLVTGGCEDGKGDSRN